MDVLSVFNFDFKVGSPNLGGTQGKVQYVPATHVKTWPALDADGVTYKTAPVLHPGKQWAETYFTKDTGSLTSKHVGDLDAGSYENELEFLVPSTSVETLTLTAIFTNGPFIFIITDGNGLRRVVGSPTLGAYCTASDVTTGKAAKERNGTTFKFMASSARPAAVCDFPISFAVAV